MQKLMLPLIIPVIIGPLTFVVMQGLKALSATIDALPPVAKRISVLVVATLLTGLGTWAGVDFNCDPNGAVNCLSTVDKDAVKAVLAAVIAFLMHFVKQQNNKG